jgi:hypothetical protein
MKSKIFIIVAVLCVLDCRAEIDMKYYKLLFSKISNVECFSSIIQSQSSASNRDPAFDNFNHLKINTTYCNDGKYNYKTLFSDQNPESIIECLYDGTKYSILNSRTKTHLVTGSNVQKTHDSIMSGEIIPFDSLRFLMETRENLTIEENFTSSQNKPIISIIEFKQNRLYTNASGDICCDFKAKDGIGTYICSFTNNSIFPNKYVLINKNNAAIIASCESSEYSNAIINGSMQFLYPTKSTLRIFENNIESQTVSIKIDKLAINQENIDQRFKVDFSKIDFVTDTDNQVTIPVGK